MVPLTVLYVHRVWNIIANTMYFTVELPVEVLKPLSNQEVIEKQTTTFECEFSKPNQTAKWFQNGDEITADWGRFKSEVDGTVYRLIITATEMSDASKYRCVIKEKQTSGKLTVLEEPLEFLRPLTDVEVQESQTATLECEVSRPNQQAKWYKEGKEIPVGGRFEVTADNTIHRLVINDAELGDQAQYSIVFADDKTSTAQVFVAGRCFSVVVFIYKTLGFDLRA